MEELSGPHAERNLTIFLIGVATGYRLQDIVDLTINDLRESVARGCFVIQEKKQYNVWLNHKKRYPQSKKEKPVKRKHDIVPQLATVIQKYIKGKKKSEYAFPSNKGNGSKHISEKSFSDILKKVAEDKEINLTQITGHSLRKTYARRLYESSGHNLEFVRIALGHKNAEVTKRYLGLEDVVKENAARIAGSKL